MVAFCFLYPKLYQKGETSFQVQVYIWRWASNSLCSFLNPCLNVSIYRELCKTKGFIFELSNLQAIIVEVFYDHSTEHRMMISCYVNRKIQTAREICECFVSKIMVQFICYIVVH